MENYTVAVNRCKIYDDSLTDLIYSQMVAAGVTKDMLDNKKIAIKPNLVISKKPEIGATTHPVFMKCAIAALKKFGAENWRKYIPIPVYDEHPEYNELYNKAWELAYEHIKNIPGMPQTPYMDEAFCDAQIWIWDTCFMSLFCKYAREVFPGVESLNNFYEVLHNDGHLGIVIPTENEPKWIGLKVGEPFEVLIQIADNPPLFSWAEYENALMSGDKEYIKNLLYDKCFLQKHYEWVENLEQSIRLKGVYVATYLIAESLGYKWEGGRSGMDNTPRGRTGEHALKQRPNNPDMLWIDAICQQALSAKIISKMFELIEDDKNYKIWQDKFLEKKKIINDYYWDAKDGFYYDINCKNHDFIKVKSIASYWTLTSGVATKEQADLLVSHLDNPNTFGGMVPFTSISRNDNDFKPNGDYWRGGVWLPTAYATLKGLKEYGYIAEARLTSLKLLEHMYRTYTDFEPHTIWEAYSPTEFKPATNEKGNGELSRPDFCGWSALGPISIYIEFILGFHTINAFTKTVEWEKPDYISGKIGINNLRFGNVITDIEAIDNKCRVFSNTDYTLVVNNKVYKILSGMNEFSI